MASWREYQLAEKAKPKISSLQKPDTQQQLINYQRISMNTHSPPSPGALARESGTRIRHKKILQYSLSLALAASAIPAISQAGMIFTDSNSFNAALPGPANITNFDNADFETLIPNGSQFGSITYNLNSGSDLIVSSNFSTTSPLNYLGVDDGFSNEFLSGDELTFTFDSLIQAFGLFIIGSPAPDSILPNDLQLVGGGLSVFNTEPEFTLDDDGEVFFLGIVDESGFDSASLISFGDPSEPFFAFNIDDITTSGEVPEPGTLIMMAFGFALLLKRSRSGLPQGRGLNRH